MNVCEQFKAALLEEQSRGMTQEKIAERHGVSQQTISRMLRPNSTCEGATLGLVQKMFPRATLNLNGTTVTRLWSTNLAQPPPQQNTSSVEAFRQKAVAAMIRLNISGDALKLVLNALMEIEA